MGYGNFWCVKVFGVFFLSFYGMAAMLKLSAWISGMVLSGLRHTANLYGEQNHKRRQI